MTTLSNEYQFLGRSNGVKASGSNYYYYLLLYAKTASDPATGKHTVAVKMRLACTADASFYGYYSAGSATINGESAISWSKSKVPASYWGNSASLTEGGVKYKRYVDLKEGTVVVDTDYAEKEIDISATWQRKSSSDSVPSFVPATTKVTASTKVLLPEIEPPVPEEGGEVEPAPPVKADYSGIRVYADGVLAYDSSLEDYDLVGLKVTKGLNVGGTAEIILPLEHPAYNYFVGHRTVVTIYRGNVLRFRGRALYYADNFYGQRTVTCEGELCFLRDSINRPYKYESTPAKIFRALVRKHNEQVEEWKQFAIGSVSVVDPNDNIVMESESAEPILSTLNKLVERCGGYIVFTTAADGSRIINYHATLNQQSSQAIEFGENLLDFSSTGANTTTLATGIVPYGAKDETTKKRITIESVNDGKDYLLAEDAVAVRGTIMVTQTWDDVTEPANLLKKARAYLDANKVFVTSLELTALDLSYLDKDIDGFAVGDMIRVTSLPHGVNEDFQLAEMTEDLLHPDKSRISLGKDILSLTRADVAGDYRAQNEVETVKVKYDTDIEKVTADVTASVIGQVSDVYTPQTTTAALEQRLTNEVNARAGIINKVNGVVSISGGAPVKILGGKVEIDGTEIHLGKEARFLNGSGIRIADKDGNSYYVLRVDNANSCVVGNDYTNLYLRGKDGVYLYKGGAAVTSDRREKNSTEELPEAYEAMLDKLTPVRFRYNGKGDRYHVGFVAQDVEEAMTSAGLSREDFGGFVDVKGDGSELALAYDEFIGLLLQKIRKLEKRLEALEE